MNCQRKRGGDWWQGLDCLDIYSRIFTQILPNYGTPTKFNKSWPVYYITHDRFAVSYALLMGLNIIYLSHNGYVYVFKNDNLVRKRKMTATEKAAAAIEAEAKKIAEIETMKTWIKENIHAETLKWLTHYSSARESYMKDKNAAINTAYESIITFTTNYVKIGYFGSKSTNTSGLIQNIDILYNNIKNYFRLLVEYAYIQATLIDISNNIFITININDDIQIIGRKRDIYIDEFNSTNTPDTEVLYVKVKELFKKCQILT